MEEAFGGVNMKKGQYSKAIITLIILLNVLFTVAVLYVFALTGSEPAVLEGAWFGFTTGELWFLAGIKKKKVDSEGNGGNDEN
jgi:flagellar basal body-associated protein FliL